MKFTIHAARRGGFALLAVALLALTVARPAVAQDAPAADEKKAADANLPPAEEIIAKYIDAIGGKETMMKIKSYHQKGTLSVPAQGVSGSVDIYANNDNKRRLEFVIANMGEVLRGYDGETAWTIHFSPMIGTKILEGDEAEDMKREAEFYEFNTYGKHYESMETVEETDFEGKTCYKVKLVDKNGNDNFQFFDKETGLLAGSQGKRKTPMGTIDVVGVVDEWKEYDGIKIPSKATQRMMGAEQVLAIESMETNKVDPAVFELPDDIKELKNEGKTSKDATVPGLEK